MPDTAEILRLLGESALVCAVAALVIRLRGVRRAHWKETSAARSRTRALESELARHRAEVLPEAVAGAHRRAAQAAQGLPRSVARTVQGLAHGQQKKITEMLNRHDDPDVVEGLLVLDHHSAQMLRRAAGLAVVCGSWPGRQHDATPLIDVVRGAVSRIQDYRRVRTVPPADDRAVTGRVVEGLVLALAELLENATRYSHPDTRVQVHTRPVPDGLALVVEDAGIGLDQAERRRVEQILAPDGPVPDLTRVGDPPQGGLAVCALLARRYGFTVHVDDGSAFGGVRAVVGLPGALLTTPVTAGDTTLAPPAPRRHDAGGPR